MTCSILLKDIDILCAAGNQHDEIQCQISRFFIARAIREVCPAAVDHVFDLKRTDMELDNSPGYSLPKIPDIDILPPEVTPMTSLGPITAEEGSIDGNYQVLEDIYDIPSSALDREKDFSTVLFPIYDDQLTVSRLRSI
jgi:hypothetical protein